MCEKVGMGNTAGNGLCLSEAEGLRITVSSEGRTELHKELTSEESGMLSWRTTVSIKCRDTHFKY